jgi:hypothetical protein
MANFNQNITSVGLTTTTFVVPLAGVYTLRGKTTLPTIVDGGGSSSVVATISQTPLSGSPTVIYTGPVGAEGFGPITVNCAASDTMSIAMSSSNPNDAGLNAVKSVIAFG